jgi:cobalt-zinc-cadmium resistance protein CzcA
MLIAGATGSGKSVTIHAIINSLLFRNSPENLKFIMIDPKRVELTLYNKIPHLLTPVITDAKKAIQENIKLPPGYIVEWRGQFELQQKANKRLAVVVPITLALIFLLLYSTFSSLQKAMLIILNIPLALVGGLIALFLTGENLSVPASVGFIALFGIAVGNGLVLVSRIGQLRLEGNDMIKASIQGGMDRLRPVLMTALAAALGLLPLVFSSGTGSEVQRPLAIVVIGGLISSTFLTLFAIPAFYGWFVKEESVEF